MYLFIYWCNIHVGEDGYINEYTLYTYIYNVGVDGLIGK